MPLTTENILPQKRYYLSVVKGIAKYAEIYRILIYYSNPVKSRTKKKY